MQSNSGIGFGESFGLRSCPHGEERATKQGDQLPNGATTHAPGGHLFRNRRPSPDGAFWDTKILTLPTCSLTHPLHRRRASCFFLFLLQVCSLTLSIADFKNAFCQSDSLDRSAGPLLWSRVKVWTCHLTCCPSVGSQRCPSSMASYLDGLAHQARISKVSAGTLSVCALRSLWKR